jgi:hypothetical protein
MRQAKDVLRMSPRSVWVYSLVASLVLILMLILLRTCHENAYDRPKITPPTFDGMRPRG